MTDPELLTKSRPSLRSSFSQALCGRSIGNNPISDSGGLKSIPTAPAAAAGPIVACLSGKADLCGSRLRESENRNACRIRFGRDGPDHAAMRKHALGGR